MDHRRWTVALFATLLSALSYAQPEELVVVGAAPEKIENHVGSLLDISTEGQISRWNDPICPRVIGLTQDYIDLLSASLGSAATAVRITVAGEGCNPNLLIFFSGNAAQTTEQLVNHFGVAMRQAGQLRLQQFSDSEAPIRWISTFDPCGFGCRLANSRIIASSAPSVQRMWAVVDLNKIQRRPFQDVADFISFVALANPSAVPKTTLPSILDLFDIAADGKTLLGLTMYDEVYLDALYSVPMDRYANQQQGAISARMLTRLNELSR